MIDLYLIRHPEAKHNETPEIIPNPNAPETRATIKNITAQINQLDKPLFSISN